MGLNNTTSKGEFGYSVEGSQCVKQLHGGCVPLDYIRYEGIYLGLHFVYPSDWNVTSASEREAGLTPRERSGDDDPTRLFVWRQSGINEDYRAVNTTLLEEGTGTVGVYDVTYEIYEGEWNGTPVKAEWVWLTYDEDQPTTNYVFFLITEAENFETDQAVLKAAVSSIVEE